jgi:hypothetical protein
MAPAVALLLLSLLLLSLLPTVSMVGTLVAGVAVHLLLPLLLGLLIYVS